MFLRSCWKIIVFILPILIVYGLFRHFYLADSDANFLPYYDDLIKAFSTAPDWSVLLKEDVKAISQFYNAGVKTFENAAVEVHDLISFFQAFGKFFEGVWQFLQMFGQVFVLVWHGISIPFKAIVWFFSVFAYPEAMGNATAGEIQDLLG